MGMNSRTPPFSTGYAVRSVAKGVRANADRLFRVGKFTVLAVPGGLLNGMSGLVATPRIVCSDARGAAR